jgi:hypothetical protein
MALHADLGRRIILVRKPVARVVPMGEGRGGRSTIILKMSS